MPFLVLLVFLLYAEKREESHSPLMAEEARPNDPGYALGWLDGHTHRVAP